MLTSSKVREYLFKFLSAFLIISCLFFICPTSVYATSISISPSTGAPGSRISLSGEGFIGKLATIYWNDKKLIQNVPVTKSGQINFSFEIPPANRGDHTIKVTDDSNWSNIVASATFTVTPMVTTEPNWGKPNYQVTLFGSGFAPGETNIKLFWDDKLLSRSPISADRTGSWHYLFVVPDSAKGEYTLSAYGDITKQDEIQSLVFTVAPFCKAKPLSGPVGTKILITGVGFRSGEDGLTFTWDGPILDTNVVAQPNGSFSFTLTAPPSTKGRHIIGIYGSSFTPKGIVPNIEFEVTPSIKLDPVSGIKGAQVKIEGAGFNASESVSLNFNKTGIGSTTTDNNGSFNAVFAVPAGTGKEQQVSATGNKGAFAQAAFITTMSTPPIPQLRAPETGAKIYANSSVLDVAAVVLKYLNGLFAGTKSPAQKFGGSSPANFTWLISGEQDGITYNFQLASNDSFSSPVFQKTDIKGSSYTLDLSTLPLSGQYYWRVKAVHETGGESAWSKAWKLEILQFSPLAIAMSIAILVLVIGILVFAAMTVINLVRSRRYS